MLGSTLHDFEGRISSPASLSSIQGPDITKPGIQFMPVTEYVATFLRPRFLSQSCTHPSGANPFSTAFACLPMEPLFSYLLGVRIYVRCQSNTTSYHKVPQSHPTALLNLSSTRTSSSGFIFCFHPLHSAYGTALLQLRLELIDLGGLVGMRVL